MEIQLINPTWISCWFVSEMTWISQAVALFRKITCFPVAWIIWSTEAVVSPWENCGGIGDLHHIANVEISDRCFVDLSLRQKFSPHPTGQCSSGWIGVKCLPLPFRSTSDCFFCPAPPGMVTGGTCKIHHHLTIWSYLTIFDP